MEDMLMMFTHIDLSQQILDNFNSLHSIIQYPLEIDQGNNIYFWIYKFKNLIIRLNPTFTANAQHLKLQYITIS